MMHKRLLILGASLLISGAAQAESNKSSGVDDGQAGGSSETVVIEMFDYSYHPAELEVEIGTTVRWVSMEKRTSHDVYFPNADIGSPRLFPEGSWERTFDEAGTYEYYCQPHENRNMQGVIRVVEVGDKE